MEEMPGAIMTIVHLQNHHHRTSLHVNCTHLVIDCCRIDPVRHRPDACETECHLDLQGL